MTSVTASGFHSAPLLAVLSAARRHSLSGWLLVYRLKLPRSVVDPASSTWLLLASRHTSLDACTHTHTHTHTHTPCCAALSVKSYGMCVRICASAAPPPLYHIPIPSREKTQGCACLSVCARVYACRGIPCPPSPQQTHTAPH